MNESAYLRRSLSQPTGGFREEGDPLCCLSESVSFGRFLAEPLAWERWSTFSHNRYLEEAERYSKPGSVAAKKAYFESHFKKKAAERAAALLDTSSDAEVSVNEDKTRDDDDSIVDVVKDVEVGSDEKNSSIERDVLVASKLDVGSIQESVVVESSNIPDEISKICDDSADQNKIGLAIEEENKLVHEECSASQDRMANSSERKPYKALLPPLKQANRVLTRKENNFAIRNEKLEKDLARKKSETSLHMSIHFSSRARESSKTTSSSCSSSLSVEKMRRLKNFTASINVFKNSSASSQTKAKNSHQASVNGTSKRSLLNLPSEDRRSCNTRPLGIKSVARGITADQKSNSSSTENSKCSNGKEVKPRSSIVSAPFSLRSEARAARRKEFYERLEERRNAEEASKKHPQTKNQPKSSAFGRKPSSSKIMCSTTSQPLTRTKVMAIENGQTVNRSVTSFSQKNSRENASPNIQNSALKN